MLLGIVLDIRAKRRIKGFCVFLSSVYLEVYSARGLDFEIDIKCPPFSKREIHS